MKKHKFNHMLALFSTMALVAGSQAVYAQQTEGKKVAAPETTEEIIITGFKASLQKAAEMKKESTSIVEVVTSEDIGKLPDKSIAESLMRLPGLAVQRVNGRAQVISIRGMDPDYSNTLLNGRQQASTGLNRSVQYDQYPAEFVNSAVVYKSPDAAVLGQGVAGTVDIHTVQPLAYGKQTIMVGARYEQNADAALNSDGTNKGNRENISYIDQFSDNTLGLALGYSHTVSPLQSERFSAWNDGGKYPTNDQGYSVLGGLKPYVYSRDLKRDSVIGTLEYAPSETFSTSLDVFYSKFDEDIIKRGIEIPLLWGGATLQPGYKVNEQGVVTDGVFTNVHGLIRNDAQFDSSELYAVGSNTKFAIGDAWTAVIDISTSKADTKELGFENYSSYVGGGHSLDFGGDTMGFHLSDKGVQFTHEQDYSDKSKVEIFNIRGWADEKEPGDEGGQKSYVSHPHITDALTQLRFDASRDLEWDNITKVTLGVNYDTRKKTATVEPEGYILYKDHRISGPLPEKTGLTSLEFLGLGNIISYDPKAIYNSPDMRYVDSRRPSVKSRTWEVDEDLITTYLKLDLAGNVGAIPVTGNVGFQVVSVDQSSDGTSSTGVSDTFDVHPVSASANYSNFLPSLNLKFELSAQDLVKVGAGKSATRPRMDAMNASSSFNLSSDPTALQSTGLDHSPWSSGGGNPKLKPWVASNADLSYEHYFNENKGYFSVATFYKELQSYVFTKKTVADFTGFPTSENKDDAHQPHTFLGWNNVPTNGKGGFVRGIEFSLSLTGEMFSDALSGFGTVFTTSRNTSSISPPDTTPHIMPGLSNKVEGIQLYYEKNGFSARISQNFRSAYLGEAAGALGGRQGIFISDTTLLDAQVGYSFESGALEGLSITLQGYNLNDEPTTVTSGPRLVDYESYGKSYALSLSYKL